MSNIYILIGEELTLKEFKIKNVLSSLGEYNYNSIYVESYRTENYSNILNQCNSFLSTFDFFTTNKVLKLVLYKPEQVSKILNGINDLSNENTIIIDLRCPEFLVKSFKFKFKNKEINPIIEYYFKFKDYEKQKVFSYTKNVFNEHKINFSTSLDLDLSLDYLFENSQNSYSFIHSIVFKLSLLDKETLTFEDILECTGSFLNHNTYKVCDRLFEAKSLNELISYIENILNSISYKSFVFTINILIEKINDFILFSNGQKCKNKANYYTFKNSLVTINNPEKLLLDLHFIMKESKTNKVIIKEELLWILINYISYKKQM